MANDAPSPTLSDVPNIADMGLKERMVARKGLNAISIIPISAETLFRGEFVQIKNALTST